MGAATRNPHPAAAVGLFLICGFALLSSISSQQDDQVTRLEFFMHDNIFVPNPSGIVVAGANGTTNSFAFGTIIVIDDALTEGPSPTSKALGRGQGTYMVSALDASSLLFTFTAVFSDRNGTLSLHGSDRIADPTRELAVVGGTGIYRFAQGYAVITTASASGLSVVLHFNVTFKHSNEFNSGNSSSSASSGTSPSASPSLGEKNSAPVGRSLSCLSWSLVGVVASLLLL